MASVHDTTGETAASHRQRVYAELRERSARRERQRRQVIERLVQQHRERSLRTFRRGRR